MSDARTRFTHAAAFLVHSTTTIVFHSQAPSPITKSTFPIIPTSFARNFQSTPTKRSRNFSLETKRKIAQQDGGPTHPFHSMSISNEDQARAFPTVNRTCYRPPECKSNCIDNRRSLRHESGVDDSRGAGYRDLIFELRFSGRSEARLYRVPMSTSRS